MSTDAVQERHVASIPLAVLRRIARPDDLPRLVPECCGAVSNVIRGQHAKGGRHVALYWEDVIRIEVGAEIEGPFSEQNGVVRSATPAGAVAYVTHFGPYRELAAAHRAIHDWSRAASRPLAGPRWEIYGHWQQEWLADPSSIRTDVFYLLAED